MKIRLATPDDSHGIRNIYAQYIHTHNTFEYTLPSEQAFEKKIADIAAFYPCIVCHNDENIVGYTYAHQYMHREAYRWNAETSMYIDREFTSKGLGTKMYRMLLDALTLQGVKTAYAGIITPNEKSLAMNKAAGFQVLGTWHKAGYKSGKWHDVLWLGKVLAEYNDIPEPVVPIHSVPQERLQKILSPEQE